MIEENNDNQDWKRYAFQVSSELLGGIIVGIVIGYSIDHFFDSKPWGLISFMFLGGIAGIYNVCKKLLKK